MLKKDNPGVFIPPPIIYAAIFFLSLWLQHLWPINRSCFYSSMASVAGWGLIGISLLLVFPAILKFLGSKNSLMTIKPANSLQTSGIYTFTRNPMYLGLLLLYSGIAIFIGNWWSFILIPILVLIIQSYVIKKEEAYLGRAFGAEYEAYKKKVRRWI